MRTSLNEIKEIEAYLENTLTTSERLFFEARMIVSRTLSQNVTLQKKITGIIQYHFREKLKKEFDKRHEQLFNHPANTCLKTQITDLFKQ